jgi:hypothetical protein
MLWAGLLALPMVLAGTSNVSAQGCATGNCPPGFGYRPLASVGTPLQCGGFCFKFFAGLHQEGPLFNYGPYTGYYPFEPYGPWTSDLRYNGPTGGCNRCGFLGRGCGPHGCGGLGGLFHRDRGGNSCGGLSMFRSVFSRLHPFQRCASAGCGSAVGYGQTASCGGCVNER